MQTYLINDIKTFLSLIQAIVFSSGEQLFIRKKKTKLSCALQFVFARLTTIVYRWRSKKDWDKPVIGAPRVELMLNKTTTSLDRWENLHEVFLTLIKIQRNNRSKSKYSFHNFRKTYVFVFNVLLLPDGGLKRNI